VTAVGAQYAATATTTTTATAAVGDDAFVRSVIPTAENDNDDDYDGERPFVVVVVAVEVWYQRGCAE